MYTQPDGCSYPLDDTDVQPHDDTHDQCWQEIESLRARLAAAEARVAELEAELTEARGLIERAMVYTGCECGECWECQANKALRGEEVQGGK